jgi:regulatory protein
MAGKSQPRSIRRVAMDLLARREHSAKELRQKLKIRGHEEDDIEATLRALKNDRLQSDIVFTESYVNHRVNAGIGPIKIRFELRQRGIDDSLTDEYLDPLVASWDPMMEQQRKRKFGQEIPSDYSLRMKQARFLQNRGFSPESVMRLFR